MRRVKSLPPMAVMVPFIMVNRIGSQNLLSDRIPIGGLEKFIKEIK